MTASERRLKREACLPAQGHSWKESRIALTRNIYLLSLITFAALIALSDVVWSQVVSTPPQSHTSDTYTLRVDTNLVILSATVLNRRNALVSGLV